MSASMTHTPINLRLLAVLAALVIAAAATFAAVSGASQPFVHTSIDRSGSIHVSNYDGGVSLSGRTQP
jgi:hypothetical protein